MKFLTLITLGALLSVTSCSHFKKSCCKNKEETCCSKDSCKKMEEKKDQGCAGESCMKKNN